MKIYKVSFWNEDGRQTTHHEYFLHKATAEIAQGTDKHIEPSLTTIEVDESLPEQHKTEQQLKAEALAKAKEVLSLDVLKRLGIL